MTRRTRTDSSAGQAEAVSAPEPAVPAHMTVEPHEWPYWQAIIGARSADSWTEIDLQQAVMLAKCRANAVQVQAQIEADGYTIVDDKGVIKPHPRHRILEDLERRDMALCRQLHVNASATQGRSRDTGERTKHQNETRANAYGDDDLIAKPVRVK